MRREALMTGCRAQVQSEVKHDEHEDSEGYILENEINFVVLELVVKAPDLLKDWPVMKSC